MRATVKAGGAPGPAASIGKVHQGRLNQQLQLAACGLSGMEAIAWEGDWLDDMPYATKGMIEARPTDRGWHYRGQQERPRREGPRPAAQPIPTAASPGGDPMSYQHLIIDDEPVGWLINNRPDVRNAMNNAGETSSPGRGPSSTRTRPST